MDQASLTPDFCSRLKEAQSIASRATGHEVQGDYGQAFAGYVGSVQKYLYLIRSLPDGPLKNQLKDMSSKLLSRAERIKSAHPQLNLRPVQDRMSSEQQELVLQISQKINGLNCPSPSSSQLTPKISLSEELWLASTQPVLSPIQKRKFAEWKSIRQVNPSFQLYKNNDPDPTDIIQDVVTDCSLIAAFSVLVNHSKSFGSNLHIKCLHPKGLEGLPEIPPDGIYRLRLFLNGIQREEMVDDKVPISSSGSMMCAQSRRNNELWPALIEKAYMKVMGGYDFVGSNSSVDLHALTNWIPETIFLTSHDYRSERSWQQIYSGFLQGHCLVSVGTNGTNPDALENVGLVPLHDYAVLDIQEDNKGLRLVTLYNAWNILEPQPTTPSRTAGLGDSLSQITSSRRPERIGTFTISWESLQVYFETVYLNWNPSQFKFTRLVHFFHNPLPTFKVKFGHESALGSESEVWILLTRHFDTQVSDSKRFMCLQVLLDDQPDPSSSTLVANRVPPPVTTTPLSNSVHLLTRFTLSESKLNYTINFSFHEDSVQKNQSNDSNSITSKPIGLTMQIYSQFSINLQDATPVPLKYSTELEGKWTSKTSGGNHSLPTYGENPMWRLTIDEEKAPSAGVQVRGAMFGASLTTVDQNGALDPGKPVNLKLLRAGGNGRVTDVEQRDLVADSGDYRLGGVRLWANQLIPGKYTIVPSTYEAGVIGSFKLRLESSLPLVKVEPIPPEGAGMFKRVGDSSWEDERKLPCSWSLTGGKGIVKLKIRLQATPRPGIYPIKLDLIQYQSSQDEGNIISAGLFTNAISGAALGPLLLSFPDNLVEYSIRVEALGESSLVRGAGYVLTIYADQPLSLNRKSNQK